MTATKRQVILTAVAAGLQFVCGVVAMGLIGAGLTSQWTPLGLPLVISGILGGLAAQFQGTWTYGIFMTACIIDSVGVLIMWIVSPILFIVCGISQTNDCSLIYAFYITVTIGGVWCIIGAILSGTTCCCGQTRDQQMAAMGPYPGVVFTTDQQYPHTPFQPVQGLYPVTALPPVHPKQPPPYTVTSLQAGQTLVTSSYLQPGQAVVSTVPQLNSRPETEWNAPNIPNNNSGGPSIIHDRPVLNSQQSYEQPVNVSEQHEYLTPNNHEHGNEYRRLQEQNLNHEDAYHHYEYLPADTRDYDGNDNERPMDTTDRISFLQPVHTVGTTDRNSYLQPVHRDDGDDDRYARPMNTGEYLRPVHTPPSDLA